MYDGRSVGRARTTRSTIRTTTTTTTTTRTTTIGRTIVALGRETEQVVPKKVLINGTGQTEIIMIMHLVKLRNLYLGSTMIVEKGGGGIASETVDPLGPSAVEGAATGGRVNEFIVGRIAIGGMGALKGIAEEYHASHVGHIDGSWSEGDFGFGTANGGIVTFNEIHGVSNGSAHDFGNVIDD